MLDKHVKLSSRTEILIQELNKLMNPILEGSNLWFFIEIF